MVNDIIEQNTILNIINNNVNEKHLEKDIEDEYINNKKINSMRLRPNYLSNIDFFVVDEADKMLDLGFEEELENILDNLPSQRQNLLFSATYPPKMLKIAQKITNDPVSIEIDEEEPADSDED